MSTPDTEAADHEYAHSTTGTTVTTISNSDYVNQGVSETPSQPHDYYNLESTTQGTIEASVDTYHRIGDFYENQTDTPHDAYHIVPGALPSVQNEEVYEPSSFANFGYLEVQTSHLSQRGANGPTQTTSSNTDDDPAYVTPLNPQQRSLTGNVDGYQVSI